MKLPRVGTPSWDALRKLRVQVSLALLVAAALCAYVASKSSGDELAAVYRETGDQVLVTASRSFSADVDGERLVPSPALERRIRALLRLHPELRWIGVFGAGRDGRPQLLASSGDPRGVASAANDAGAAIRARKRVESEEEGEGRHLVTHAAPLRPGTGEAGALALAFDLGSSDAALSQRNRNILIVLSGLLLAFTAFTTAVLDRGIFRPLNRLRAATNRMGRGDLATRLGWKRRDEIGVLARDFDEMAAALERGQKRLEGLAHEDALTGLSNHRHFQETLQRETAEAHRTGGSVALAVVDIDYFKRINDARGHPFGDEVLRAAGQRLSAALSGIGYAARLGGDEFAVILPGADRARAFALCEAARAAVASHSPLDYELSCSAGVACYPEDARNATDLVQLADGALYWAKSTGRAQSRVYDPQHVMVVTDEQRVLFGALLERPQAIRPVFQPLVSLGSGEVVGYEALARFDDSRNLPPSWWFAQAHRFGLGAQLEAEAVRVALAEPRRPEHAFLAVNLSPSALRSPAVQEVLPDDLSGLVIEITEHEEILLDDGLQATLAPLRARGARIAVDDAGAGYAGLQQVMRMQADIIKLDRSLIQDIHADRVKAALVHSLVHFASETGADLCAEGIECLEELRTLVQLGVTLAQGYVLARPAPAWAGVDPDAAAVCRSRPSRPSDSPRDTVFAPVLRSRSGHHGRRPV